MNTSLTGGVKQIYFTKDPKDNTKFINNFKDYVFHYYDEREGQKILSYNTDKSLAEKDLVMSEMIKSTFMRVAGISQENISGINTFSLATNPAIVWAMGAVTSELIPAVLPDVMEKTIGAYTQIHNVGYGGYAKLRIKPNHLFYVSKAGQDQRTAALQRTFDTNITIMPEKRLISVYTDLYRTLMGEDSMAEFVMKAIMSVQASMLRDVYTGFVDIVSQIPAAPNDTALNITGFEKKEVMRVAQTVTALNNGNKAIFMGTPIALSDILPDNANYRYSLEDGYVKLGYIQEFGGFSVLPMQQTLNINDTNKLLLKDDEIYVLSPAAGKIMHLAIENSLMVDVQNPMSTYDGEEITNIHTRYGVGFGTNASMGLIKLV